MNSLSLKEDINVFLTEGSFSYSCKLHTKLREWFDAPDAEDQPYAKNTQVHKIWKMKGLVSKLKGYA